MDAPRTARQLQTLMDLSAVVNSSLDTGTVRRRAVEAATELLDAERGSLLLLDPETGDLLFEVVLGEVAGAFSQIRLRRGEGLAGWVAQNDEPIIVHDVQADPRFFSDADSVSEFVTRDMVCVPVRSRQRVVGVLQAINSRGGSFDETDRDLLLSLGHQVAVAIENAGLYRELKESFIETAAALADTVEKRDPYTGGHTRRVMEYSVAIGIRLRLSTEELEQVRLAAILHDIGKIGIPDRILLKPDRLDDVERAVMNGHSVLATEILGHVKRLSSVMPAVRWHHEKLDGSGYPDSLSGDAIPQVARIVAVADAFDAMTTNRAYRSGRPPAQAVAELERCAGSQFGEAEVIAFAAAFHGGELQGVLDQIAHAHDQAAY